MADKDNNPASGTMYKKVQDLLGRVEDLERQIDDNRRDSAFPDLSPAGDAPEIRTAAPIAQLPAPIVLPFDIEFGKPTADVTTDVATVTLQPCDQAGTSYASASTVTTYVANDRQTQETSGRGWTTSTILSFVRFTPWVSGSPNIEAYLIGEAIQPAPQDVEGIISTEAGLLFDEWIHISANVTGYILDSRDWSGREIHVAAKHVSGSSCHSDPPWDVQSISYWTRDITGTPTPAWVAATENQWWEEITNTGGSAQNIVKLDDGTVAGVVSMDTNGDLIFTSTGWTSTDYYMRVTIRAGKQREQADKIEPPPPT